MEGNDYKAAFAGHTSRAAARIYLRISVPPRDALGRSSIMRLSEPRKFPTAQNFRFCKSSIFTVDISYIVVNEPFGRCIVATARIAVERVALQVEQVFPSAPENELRLVGLIAMPDAQAVRSSARRFFHVTTKDTFE